MRVFVFWFQVFCKTVLCRFFIRIYRVFKAKNCFFNESVCFFGFRHFVSRCCAVFSYEFIGLLRPELFFQWERLFFWLQAFCKTVLCRFFKWIYKVFKDRMVFSMRVFVFFGFRHFVRRCCAVFSYEFIGFLRPELFFQWECWFLWLQAFCKTVLRRFFLWIYKVFKARMVFSKRVFVFWFQAFCKTVLCRLFIRIYRVFKARIVFSMRVFVFFGFKHFVRRCCAVFSNEFIGFLRPEWFFQWECVFLVSGIL